MSHATQLAALYAAIPRFECKPGCTDCCGPVPLAKAEWAKIRLVPRKASASCLSCAYLADGGGCSVYRDRPFLCRLFGATTDPKLACPHGCGPAKPLSARQAAVLTAKYVRLMGPTPAALTGDLPDV